jgi:iron complex transport system substrate-binding protein
LRTRIPARPRPCWFLAATLVLLLAAEAAAAAIEVRDDSGRTVRLARPARRIVALYGAFNEMLVGMGLAERIAARTKADALPEALADRPVIGTHLRPNLELIVGLAPDLVLQAGGRREAGESAAALRRLGLPVAVFELGSFAALFSAIERLGALTGEPGRAEALVGELSRRLARVERAVAKAARPRVFFEARYPNLLAAGQGSMVADIVRRAGGQPCVAGAKKLVRLSEEELLRLDPEVYLVQQGPMNPAPGSPAARPHFRTLSAVRQGRVFVVDERAYSRPGPRNVDAVEELAGLLHPDLFPGRRTATAKDGR